MSDEFEREFTIRSQAYFVTLRSVGDAHVSVLVGCESGTTVGVRVRCEDLLHAIQKVAGEAKP